MNLPLSVSLLLDHLALTERPRWTSISYKRRHHRTQLLARQAEEPHDYSGTLALGPELITRTRRICLFWGTLTPTWNLWIRIHEFILPIAALKTTARSFYSPSLLALSTHPLQPPIIYKIVDSKPQTYSSRMISSNFVASRIRPRIDTRWQSRLP